MDLRQQLMRDEGVKLHAYRDSLGYWTIGVGHLIDPTKGCQPPPEMTYPDGPGVVTERCVITQDVCLRLLDADIAGKMAELRKALPWVDALSEPHRGVLLNMAFNMGVKGLLKFTDTLRLVQKGQYAEAANKMLLSRWATQVGARARRLAQQMRTDTWV